MAWYTIVEPGRVSVLRIGVCVPGGAEWYSLMLYRLHLWEDLYFSDLMRASDIGYDLP